VQGATYYQSIGSRERLFDWQLFALVPIREWEIIADKLSKAGWSLGWVSAVDFEGRTMWIADAHRGTMSLGISRTKCLSHCPPAR
jgi:hypothetical protein